MLYTYICIFLQIYIYTASCNVTSGIVQRSCLSLVQYIILTNSLLRLLVFPNYTFANGLKFVADVTVHTQHEL